MFWDKSLKLTHDELETHTQGRAYGKFRNIFYQSTWNKVYDFIEALIECDQTGNSQAMIKRLNQVFKEEKVGYRIIGGLVTQNIQEEEIKAIDEALNSPYEPIKIHIQSSLSLLSDRKKPDYRNSIKESISAVECVSKIIVGKRNTTLGQAIKTLEESGLDIHPALKKGFSNLYGWTSDDSGIRHALLDEESVDFDHSMYMLVTCSAFVNFLISKADEVGIDLMNNYQMIRDI